MGMILHWGGIGGHHLGLDSCPPTAFQKFPTQIQGHMLVFCCDVNLKIPVDLFKLGKPRATKLEESVENLVPLPQTAMHAGHADQAMCRLQLTWAFSEVKCKA